MKIIKPLEELRKINRKNYHPIINHIHKKHKISRNSNRNTRNGLSLKETRPNYMEDDKESRNYGAMMLWTPD